MGDKFMSGFRVERHPRARYKSLQCQSGIHTWSTGVLCGIPVMVCNKCGATVTKSILDHTLKEREYRQFTPKEHKPETRLELYERVWEESQKNPRR